MMVTEGRGGPSVRESARRAAEAGVDVFQVREKTLPGGALLRLVREVVQDVSATSMRVVVNGRPDIATLAGAHGVHLPASGLCATDVRASFPGLETSVSCHSLAEAKAAARQGADYLLFGPVFATPGKEARASGTGPLAEIVRGVPIPVFAIGGVTPEHASELRAAGAKGVAAIRLLQAADLRQVVAALRSAWNA
jgi:thiamine-phosphate pyrophosphorylase